MVVNSTASTKKYGGPKYYVCGGYMRKGKEFCPYVSWRKDHIERIVANKLRSTLLRLTFDNQLEEEIQKCHGEANRHLKIQAANFEAEISFLEKRIIQMENELQSGGGKTYYAEMIKEMRGELEEKLAEYEKLSELSPQIDIAPEYIQTVLNDIKQMISMLDDENPNPQLMNEYVRKFVSNVSIDRDTKMVHIKVKIQIEECKLFEKTVVAEW
ncbi:recombinase-like zinc beta ribbon protein [Cohnella sp. SGD-V74]|uniref:zinc ribbon domain-containing protein n=1 Tax=unclassified Cohnella TaxID=2636738 RepID=UPI000D41ED92|nr:recombinase-like zinc beta ribbon protein [Cohnella sp. SGD-V74]